MKKKDNDKTNEVLPAVPVPLADKPLTEEEDKFCELYVSGGPLYAGNHRKCYEEVFGKGKNVPIASRLLLGRPHISARIREMIDSVSEKAQAKVDWNKVWSKKYPVLASYQQTVRVGDYAPKLRELLARLRADYGYSETDALLVLKDILARVWQGRA